MRHEPSALSKRKQRECQKKADEVLAQLSVVREMLRKDKRLSVILIKPFVLFQIWKSERRLRRMT